MLISQSYKLGRSDERIDGQAAEYLRLLNHWFYAFY